MISIEAADWQIVGHPGYLGKRRDDMYSQWNEQYGLGNWQLGWKFDGQLVGFLDLFNRVYVPGYIQYFYNRPQDAEILSSKYAYAYDIDPIDRQRAFDPLALVDKPGVPNQFHHTALNWALVYGLGLPFQGSEPIQVRGGKPGASAKDLPKGWRWHPGLIPAVRPDLIEPVSLDRQWWDDGSIEDTYQRNKVLLTRFPSR